MKKFYSRQLSASVFSPLLAKGNQMILISGRGGTDADGGNGSGDADSGDDSGDVGGGETQKPMAVSFATENAYSAAFVACLCNCNYFSTRYKDRHKGT